ncbi:hypothetical protein ACIQTN_25900 [Streptomyces werraensis]|uniref:hypothetical protein n=1 Tax=Streptomyces werraensis TaxID=68284 RepID=UPI0038207667
MTDRHTVDSITSDALDALYEQLEAAEAGEAQRQLATAREALASATTRAARAEAALARVRALADLIDTGAPWTTNHTDLAARIRAAANPPATTGQQITQAQLDALRNTNTPPSTVIIADAVNDATGQPKEK